MITDKSVDALADDVRCDVAVAVAIGDDCEAVDMSDEAADLGILLRAAVPRGHALEIGDYIEVGNKAVVDRYRIPSVGTDRTDVVLCAVTFTALYLGDAMIHVDHGVDDRAAVEAGVRAERGDRGGKYDAVIVVRGATAVFDVGVHEGELVEYRFVGGGKHTDEGDGLAGGIVGRAVLADYGVIGIEGEVIDRITVAVIATGERHGRPYADRLEVDAAHINIGDLYVGGIEVVADAGKVVGGADEADVRQSLCHDLDGDAAGGHGNRDAVIERPSALFVIASVYVG